MCGNNRRLSPVIALCLLAIGAVSVRAVERRLPEEPFRFGVEGEPGLKSVWGEAFQLDYGLVFKIQERFSIIPRFGFQFYTDTYRYNDYGNHYVSRDEDRMALNICLTFRYEFVRRLTLENTRYEYDVEKREFKHYYYASPLRPYVQFHAGSFTGFGGGISYYLLPQVGVGIGADMGWNWIAVANDQRGFAIIAPKAVVTILFN